jgi:hypothetical protein
MGWVAWDWDSLKPNLSEGRAMWRRARSLSGREESGSTELFGVLA